MEYHACILYFAERADLRNSLSLTTLATLRPNTKMKARAGQLMRVRFRVRSRCVVDSQRPTFFSATQGVMGFPVCLGSESSEHC